MRDFNDGNERTFKQVFGHYYPGLFVFVKKHTDNKEEAELISLRTFQTLFNCCKLFEAESDIKAFLYVCARNLSYNYIRGKQKEKEQLKKIAKKIVQGGLSENESTITDDMVDALHKEVQELPVECGLVFKLLYYKELTPADVAKELNIPVSVVHNQENQALLALRNRIT